MLISRTAFTTSAVSSALSQALEDPTEDKCPVFSRPLERRSEESSDRGTQVTSTSDGIASDPHHWEDAKLATDPEVSPSGIRSNTSKPHLLRCWALLTEHSHQNLSANSTTSQSRDCANDFLASDGEGYSRPRDRSQVIYATLRSRPSHRQENIQNA